ncbi:major facilitator superfamily transporter [Fusarium phyllophilum]|uniref:Major facilitator superfamily transporter n=1 Tax=Fusarium phyllophilum TaxID=47803 RepID=A0A8H5IG34_9HYPO|nr:major facilitator superfamily transporter [Fusarium phyllophilum]
MLAPALETISNDLHTDACFYILWNTVAGFSKSSGLLIASRLLSGLGASAEFAVTNPVLSDMWRAEERGTSFAISTFVPLLGPALGPIVGGAVTQTVGWRWTFWVLSIFDGILVVIALFVFNESYEVVLLETRAARLRYTVAAQGGAILMDKLWGYLKKKASDDTASEYRVPLMLPGAILIPLGLFLYDWSAERHIAWIVPDIGIAIFGCGVILNTQALQAYVMDAFRKYVASASAASQFLRSIAGFAFPVFAPAMY